MQRSIFEEDKTWEREITNEMLADISKMQFSFFKRAESGAMGCPGSIEAYDCEGNIYFGSWLNGELDEEVALQAYRELAENHDDWEHVHLGMGNHLLVAHQYYEKFSELTMKIIESRSAIYRNWKNVAEQLLYKDNLKIYLLDKNKLTSFNWKRYFDDMPNVEIVCDDFGHFMDTHEVECVVSPANAYGFMDGGYDLAISKWFGWDLQKKVQNYILRHFMGEQPVGTSFCIGTGKNDIKLIHTPTMRIPSTIREPLVIYQAMRTTLMTAKENHIKSIVIPAFGAATGGVDPQIVSKMMWEAYNQIFNHPSWISVDYAIRWEPEFE